MKIEEHLEHYENPAMCIDPDNCPVVYAMYQDSILAQKDGFKIEEHIEHYENPAYCIDPDGCPVVYARMMQEWEDEFYSKREI